MLATVRQAAEAEIDEVLGWTHQTWGDAVELAAYRARTHALRRTPWGQAGYRFWVATDGAGAAVAACKAYALDVRVLGRAAQALGFGAVFTRSDRRGEGHAARLLRGVTADAAARGVAYGLLMSDIGGPYYARLGYRALGVEEARAPALSGGAPFRPWAPGAPIPADWRQAGAFAVGRSPAYWAYLLERNRPSLWAWVPDGPDAPARGFLALNGDDALTEIEEAGHDPAADPRAFWLDVRRLAGARGSAIAQGCLPAAAIAAGFVAKPLEQPLVMVAAFHDAPLPARSQLWWLDFF